MNLHQSYRLILDVEIVYVEAAGAAEVVPQEVGEIVLQPPLSLRRLNITIRVSSFVSALFVGLVYERFVLKVGLPQIQIVLGVVQDLEKINDPELMMVLLQGVGCARG